MTTRIVESERDRSMLITFVQQQPLPVTVSVKNGGKRTTKQNKLNRLWMTEIADQSGWTAEYARGYCKLTIGVPLLRAENEEFAAKYDEFVKPLPYETKIGLMQEPLDFPITRLMSTKQQTRYLDEVLRHFSEKGIMLTMPEDGLISDTEAPVGPVSAADPAPVDKPAPSLSTDPIRKYAAQCLATVQTEKTDPAGVIRALWMAHVELMGGPAMDQGLYTLITDIAAQCLEVLEGVVPFGKAEETIAFRLNCRLEDLR